MKRWTMPLFAACIILSTALVPLAVSARTVELENGLRDHGVCAPVSIARGVCAARGRQGEPLLLAQLLDVRGGYGMLRIDLDSGRCDFAELPVQPNSLNSIFSAMFSRRNRFYAQHSEHFFEYNPEQGKWTFAEPIRSGKMSMSMTEDDRGRIWSISYPDCGITAFDPETQKLQDYGAPFAETFPQYARSVATDDRGWVYIGYGNAAGQIAGFHPESGRTMTVLAEKDRPTPGAGLVFRAEDGNVYGTFGAAIQYRNVREFWHNTPGREWYRLHDGTFEKIHAKPEVPIADILSGTQDFYDLRYPDGRTVEIDIPARRLTTIDRNGKKREISFDYPSQGAHQVSIAALEDGRISGGTSFPMSNFVYDPANDQMMHRNGAVQWNVVLPYRNHLFVAAYLGGYLLDWQVDQPYFMPPRADDADGNPRLLAPPARPHIGRPNALAITPDGRYLLMGGTPHYGLTGGGLAIYDRETSAMRVLTDRQLIPDQSVHALATLPGGRIFGGTTINAGTGGKVKAKEAEFFELDLASGKILRHEVLFPKARTYFSLLPLPDGTLLGVVDGKTLFRFDPAAWEITGKRSLAEFGGVIYQQGPRFFLPHGKFVWLLTRKGVLRLNPETLEVTPALASPVPIEVGGAIADGRIYFGSRGRLYSLPLPE